VQRGWGGNGRGSPSIPEKVSVILNRITSFPRFTH
jgi:hypothetical protein